MPLRCQTCILLTLASALTGCTKSANTSPTFTLASGVAVVSASDCVPGDEPIAPQIEKSGSDYFVTTRTFLDCGDNLGEPYLTERVPRSATLVLHSAPSSRPFNSGCECLLSLKIKISGRLEPGTTLYVLADSDVLGHLTVP